MLVKKGGGGGIYRETLNRLSLLGHRSGNNLNGGRREKAVAWQIPAWDEGAKRS